MSLVVGGVFHDDAMSKVKSKLGGRAEWDLIGGGTSGASECPGNWWVSFINILESRCT